MISYAVVSPKTPQVSELLHTTPTTAKPLMSSAAGLKVGVSVLRTLLDGARLSVHDHERRGNRIERGRSVDQEVRARVEARVGGAGPDLA